MSPYRMIRRVGMGGGGSAMLSDARRRAHSADMVSMRGVLRVIDGPPLGRHIFAKKLGWTMM